MRSDLIADLDILHIIADRFDDAGSIEAKNGRERGDHQAQQPAHLFIRSSQSFDFHLQHGDLGGRFNGHLFPVDGVQAYGLEFDDDFVGGRGRDGAALEESEGTALFDEMEFCVGVGIRGHFVDCLEVQRGRFDSSWICPRYSSQFHPRVWDTSSFLMKRRPEDYIYLSPCVPEQQLIGCELIGRLEWPTRGWRPKPCICIAQW